MERNHNKTEASRNDTMYTNNIVRTMIRLHSLY